MAAQSPSKTKPCITFDRNVVEGTSLKARRRSDILVWNLHQLTHVRDIPQPFA